MPVPGSADALSVDADAIREAHDLPRRIRAMKLPNDLERECADVIASLVARVHSLERALEQAKEALLGVAEEDPAYDGEPCWCDAYRDRDRQLPHSEYCVAARAVVLEGAGNEQDLGGIASDASGTGQETQP